MSQFAFTPNVHAIVVPQSIDASTIGKYVTFRAQTLLTEIGTGGLNQKTIALRPAPDNSRLWFLTYDSNVTSRVTPEERRLFEAAARLPGEGSAEDTQEVEDIHTRTAPQDAQKPAAKMANRSQVRPSKNYPIRSSRE